MAIPVWTEKDWSSASQFQVIMGGVVIPVEALVPPWSECEQAAPTYTECSQAAGVITEKSRVAPTWTEKSS